MSQSAMAKPQTIAFELDGQPVQAEIGESILDVATRLGVRIPHLCYKPGLRADGNCRVCVVEIEGERALAPSCCRAPTEGMIVHTDSSRARKSQTMVLELLRGDVTDTPYTIDSELQQWCDALDVKSSRFGGRQQPASDNSHAAIAVNLDACIQCTRCLRACREEQVNDVIGFAGRGSQARIIFDLEDP
ncbi:MAG: 2Fe-2S iron-sulfur cluster-binding protein, partial [Granulosicoccaceae bacterium]